MDRKMEIISNLSEICNKAVVLCKVGEIVIPAYVLNNSNNVYMMNGIKLIVHLFVIIVSYLKQITY